MTETESEKFAWEITTLTESQISSFHAVHKDWNELRGKRFTPAWQDIDLQSFEYSSISHICVIDVQDSPPFKYRFFESSLTELHHLELTNKTTAEIMPLAYRRLCEDQYARIIESRSPMLFVGSVKSELGFERKHYNLRFPLSDDGETITNILTIENYDEIPDEMKKVYRDSSL